MSELPRRARPSRWHRPLWWANLLAVPPLLLAYLSTLVSPATFWPLAFFGMAYPFVLLTHFFFLVWWALFRPKRMLVSAIVVGIGFGHIGDHLQVLGRRHPPKDIADEHLKVMSYNVRLYEL